MPAAPKSPQSKRGTPKAKGAIRAKSGCYTCRIRRKKCDEQQSLDTGSCQTCIRLKLECLGFGAKRPEWLREARNVTEVREKIKNFLASQGMIKGHSGAAPTAPSRSAEPEPSPHLRLHTDREGSYSDSSSGSPPTPTLTLSESSSYRHLTSSMRDEPLSWHAQSAYPPSQSGEFSDSVVYTTVYSCHAGLYPSGLQRDHSPYQDSVHEQSNYQFPDNTLVPASRNPLIFPPAIRSTFGGLYHWEPSQEDVGDWEQFQFHPSHSDFYLCSLPTHFYDHATLQAWSNGYRNNVIYAQYLLVPPDVPELILEAVNRHAYTRQAAEILTSVYFRRSKQPHIQAIGPSELNERLEPLSGILSRKDLVAEDAMAALHVVSSFLFDGGQGAWQQWLLAASRYVHRILTDTKYISATDALCRCSAKDAFVIKTTIWFDVLAAITTGEEPIFLASIREMFDPNVSRIVDPAYEAQFSMMSPMGCENRVVWALAETSQLAAYKRKKEEEGCLSITTLVSYANDIEVHLDPPEYSIESADTLKGRCQLASEVFRTSTRLYLRSVVSGDHPQVPEIAQSVRDVIHCIQRVTQATTTNLMDGGENGASRSVTRNTVFGFYIAGALANRYEGREIIRAQLQHEGRDFGNCGSILQLLEGLWAKRDQSPPNVPVPWRDELRRTWTLLV